MKISFTVENVKKKMHTIPGVEHLYQHVTDKIKTGLNQTFQKIKKSKTKKKTT